MTLTQETTPTGLWTTRIAVSMMFFAHGAVFANWAARIPDVQATLGLSEVRLGFVLLGMSFGVLTALPLAGWLIGRLGSRSLTTVTGVLHGLALIPLGLAVNFWTLFIALFTAGVVGSLMDMAMNAQGVEVERRFGASIMSSLHALFSLGLAFGAFMSGLMSEFPVLTHFIIAGVVIAASNLIFSFGLLNTPRDKSKQDEREAVFSLPPRALWLVGILALCAVIGEGAMIDWSTKYMRDIVGANAENAAYGLTVFSLMMTVGRFSGDWLVERFNRVMVVRLGGLLAAGGIGLTVILPSYMGVLVGLGLAGLGLATIIPLAFSAAGNTPGIQPGVGIAGVATIGYAAFLIGPPVVGGVAEQVSLRASFAIIAALMLVLVAIAGSLRPTPRNV
jgi:MFS family permease